ncbi:MAG: double-strand break repair protein AddB [Rhizobiaceae bacterium]
MVGLRDSHVFSIPPGAPFLRTLVEALLDGTLVEGFHPQRDPLMLADATIWLPTRRAARAMASEFVTRFDGEAAFLPQIHALGDPLDDPESFMRSETAPDALDAMAIDPMARHLTLTVLIEKWSNTLNERQHALFAGADVAVPSSTADAVRFAAELAQLMDTVATEETDWKRLKKLVPEDHADWWQLTLEFLKIATKAWPEHLAEHGLQDGTVLRAQRLHQRAVDYARAAAESRLKGPVIAAGSTGSIPATANLLKTISRLSMGAVVLPGLDRDMEAEVWAKIDSPENEHDERGTGPGHSQYGLKKLLGHLQIHRDSVHHLGGIDDTSEGFARARERLVSEALRPSYATGRWHEGATLPDKLKPLNAPARTKALEGIALIEAPGEREEALAIALALRETLATDGATAALVTPDRNLARRVAIEMRRFGVSVDDSAGQPLRNRQTGTFARLVVDCAFGEGGTVALASLIKHPLARFGATPARAKRAGLILELALMRGSTQPSHPGDLPGRLAAKRNEIASEETRHKPRSLTRLSANDWDDGNWLADRLAGIFSTGVSAATTVDTLATHTIAILEACAADESEGLTPLYGSQAGQALQGFLADLLDHGSTLACTPSQWPAVFDALLDGRTVRPVGGTHPRVTILGPIEARLQDYDRVVLGGLNEKTWPAATRNDPFLSRPMRQTLGLPAPERRTGLAAHDFQMLLGMKDTVVTRSAKVDNAPAVASRWVQRLSMVAGEETVARMRAAGRRFLDWATQIDLPPTRPKACPRPEPKPPTAMRPRSLSITEIETWIRDPYAIYAKHVLKLDALDPLTREIGPLERGALYHSIMEDFAKLSAGEISEASLLSIARKRFDEQTLPSEVEAVWWPRFKTLVGKITNWHYELCIRAEEIFVEQNGQTDDELEGFVLRGRADRIDLLADGSVSLIDYKTGLDPSKKQVEALLAPQLPLEAAMAARGAFEDVPWSQAAELAYVRLRPSGEFKIDMIGDGSDAKKKSAAELGEAAWAELLGLIRAYGQESRGYTSKQRPWLERYESDYDHLARVREWSVDDYVGGDTGAI